MEGRRPLLALLHPAAVSLCKLVIRTKLGTTVGSETVINLNEIKLYGASGSPIPASHLQFSMSTAYPGLGVDRCFDGELAHASDPIAGVGCHSGDNDPNPWLNVVFVCNTQRGSAKGIISKVEVYNRPDNMARITHFQLDYVNSSDITDWSYSFNSPETSYTICAPSLLLTNNGSCGERSRLCWDYASCGCAVASS